MADSPNFQDWVRLDESSALAALGGAAKILGAGTGGASLVMGQDSVTSVGTIIWNPQTTRTLSIQDANGVIGFVQSSLSYPDNYPSDSFGSSNAGLSIMPFKVPYNISATQLLLMAHMSGASNSSGALTLSVAVYTMSGSTASLASSGSRQISWTSGATSGTATTVSSLFGGVSGTQYRSITLGTWNITPGNYLFGFYGRTSNAGSWTFFGGSTLSIANAVETGQTQFYLPGFSTSSFTTALPSSFNLTDTNYVRTGASALRQVGFLLLGTGP